MQSWQSTKEERFSAEVIEAIKGAALDGAISSGLESIQETDEAGDRPEPTCRMGGKGPVA
ncbi:MAG: hypothetical protein AAGF23_21290 [Acidobacteriota bacterium]